MFIYGISRVSLNIISHIWRYDSALSYQIFVLEQKYEPIEGKIVHSGNIEDIEVKEKSKFPQNFFPEVLSIGFYSVSISLCHVNRAWFHVAVQMVEKRLPSYEMESR